MAAFKHAKSYLLDTDDRQIRKLVGVVGSEQLPNVKIVNQRCQAADLKAGQSQKFFFTITNSTEVEWPENSQLICSIKGNKTRNPFKVPPKTVSGLTIEIKSSLTVKPGIYEFNFCFMSPKKKDSYGETFSIQLTVNQTDEDQLYVLASELAHKTCHSFQDCYKVLQECYGDAEQAYYYLL